LFSYSSNLQRRFKKLFQVQGKFCFRLTSPYHGCPLVSISAGVDVTVIRSWLGHVSLDTTNHYAQASLETKRKALEQVDSKLHSAKPPRWKRDADLLAWLDSL